MKRKDLAEALRFLESFDRDSAIEPINDSAPAGSAPSAIGNLRLSGWERDWEVLDTCLNADDMKLVANAYRFLKDRGFLPNFGKCRNIGTPLSLSPPCEFISLVLKFFRLVLC